MIFSKQVCNLESSWRHSMFVMLPKSGDLSDTNNWRPTAILRTAYNFSKERKKERKKKKKNVFCDVWSPPLTANGNFQTSENQTCEFLKNLEQTNNVPIQHVGH